MKPSPFLTLGGSAALYSTQCCSIHCNYYSRAY